MNRRKLLSMSAVAPIAAVVGDQSATASVGFDFGRGLSVYPVDRLRSRPITGSMIWLFDESAGGFVSLAHDRWDATAHLPDLRARLEMSCDEAVADFHPGHA